MNNKLEHEYFIHKHLVLTFLFTIGFILTIFFFNFLINYWPNYLTIVTNKKSFLYLILPFIGTIIFGIIDALFFLIFEDEYLRFINHYIDNIIISSLVLGGISSFVAIYFGRNTNRIIELIISDRIESSPLQEGVGIIIGTFIVIFIYIIYKKYKRYKDNIIVE